MLAPAEIVQRVFGREAELAPEFVGEEAIEAGAFVDFVEVRQSFAFEKDFSGPRVFDGRAIDVVEEAFDEVAGGREVLESLLILNADCAAAKFIREAHRGDIHFALIEKLIFGEVRFRIFPGVKGHSFFTQPGEGLGGFVIVDFKHGGEERRLAEAFLEKAGPVQKFIGNDRVEHAHATFIEDAHDRFVFAEGLRDEAADALIVRGNF
jgi:hypothetical protein